MKTIGIQNSIDVPKSSAKSIFVFLIVMFPTLPKQIFCKRIHIINYWGDLKEYIMFFNVRCKRNFRVFFTDLYVYVINYFQDFQETIRNTILQALSCFQTWKAADILQSWIALYSFTAMPSSDIISVATIQKSTQELW